MGRLASVVLRGINQFPKTLDALVQVLSRFEANVAKAIDQLDGDKLDAIWPTTVNESTYQLRLGEVAIVSTMTANVDAYLPVSSPGNQGRFCGIIHTDHNFAVFARSVGQLVQGKSYDSLPSVGLYLYYSTGTGWYRTDGTGYTS